MKISVFDLTDINLSHIYNLKRYPDYSLDIKSNIKYVKDKIGVESLILMNQTHSNEVINIKDVSRDFDIIDADGLVTTQHGIALGVQTADCVPLILYSDDIIGAIHCGWRGVLDGIVENTLKKFRDNTNRDIAAYIGPAIQQNNYEVDIDFYQNFIHKDPTSKEFFKSKNNDNESVENSQLITEKHSKLLNTEHFQQKSQQTPKLLFNLPKYVEHKLLDNNISHINNSNEDTYPQPDKYPSYRRSSIMNQPTLKRILTVVH